jgi:hypothetical protein
MTALRDHGMFQVTISVDRQDRIEDSLGELRGYGAAYRVEETLNVVAPSEPVATAWALHHRRVSNPELVSVTETKLHGFVQDHIW